MKTFKIGIGAPNTEKMWEFARAHDMHVHYVSSIRKECDSPIDTFNNTVYVYELTMTPETSTAFGLSVPLVSFS